MRSYSALVILLSLLLVTVACGGGGGAPQAAPAPEQSGNPDSVGTPRIDAIAGTVVTGDTFTITGAGFGNKDRAGPWQADDFESGSFDAGWTRTEAPWAPGFPKLTQALPRGDSDYAAQCATTSLSRTFADDTRHAYYYGSFWIYLQPDLAFASDSGTQQIKLMRLYGHNGSTVLPNFYPIVRDAPYNNFMVIMEGGYATGTDISQYHPDGAEANLPRGQWNHIEMLLQPSSATGVDDGAIEIYCNGRRTFHFTDTTTAAADPNAFTFRWEVPGTVASLDDADLPVYDDIYMETSAARVYLSTAASWAERIASGDHSEIQMPVTWTDTSITCSVRTGTFSSGEQVYCYVVNPDNEVNAEGHPVTIGLAGGG